MSIQKRRKKDHIKLPRSVQDAIPISTVYDDGLFRVGKNQYSRTYKFEDINYQVASEADKETMFERYCALLNSLDSNVTTKITINNRKLNQADFEKRIFIKEQDDNLNEYRREYNQMLIEKATAGNSIIQEKYITVTVTEKSAEDARQYFNRFGASLAIQLNKIGSKCTELGAVERLRIFYDFYRTGEESDFAFDLKDSRRKGHNFKDYICPDSMEIQKDHIVLGERYARVLFLKEYANFLKDDFVTELTTRCKNMMLSIDLIPVPTGKAVREVETRLLGTETNITNWQRKQNANNNFSAEVPYDLEMQRQELREFLDDLSGRDQKMMLSVLTIVITADSLEELNQQTKSMQELARERVSQIAVLKFQQMDGLNTVLPAGVQKLDLFRTLITESIAIQIPFRVQEIAHAKGIFYGQNVISKNMILADRTQLLNGNSFILGVSGSGKSFAAKCEITNHVLATDADILVIDPEREYAPLVRALGGEVIEISATSPNHINAMDMTKDYGEINPIIEKSQFLQSLCEQIIAGHTFTKGQQSIIDRCTESVYRYYLQESYQGVPPTLQDFREEPTKQEEETPEIYAEQNASRYGRKYASAVKTQGRKLLIRQKKKEWQHKKFREQGARAETLPSSESTSRQPTEKRAGVQADDGTVNANLKQRQILQARRKKQAHISSVLREKGYADRKYALPIFSRKAKGTGPAGVKTAKRLSKGTKKVISTIITGGSTMLLLLAVIIPLCAAAAVFGSDDDGKITSNNALVAIAQSQIGNEGGETYWRWYGFEHRVDWCAIFVSWCSDQAGMLETESLPKYAVCDEGLRWFIRNGKWYNRKIEPKPGMILFFDWDDDGVSEHTGIVEKCEDGIVYTIEGNSHDVCKRKWYATGDRTIMGYGVAR